ncbi:MAG: NfeD family protein [Parachlamydiales bacterium]|nr:NfeD family protein [Parachlamydiales bacterium]
MIFAVLLALLGLGSVYLEFFLPGGVMSILGGALLVASIVMTYFYSPFFVFLLFIVAVLVLLWADIKLALRHVSKKSGIFLSSDQEGFSASTFRRELIGHVGIAATDLGPSGQIMIEKTYYQAQSISSYVRKGEEVLVTGGEGARLFVKKM